MWVVVVVVVVALAALVVVVPGHVGSHKKRVPRTVCGCLGGQSVKM